MRGYVGVTDDEWYRYLAARPQISEAEVNFWRPGGGREFRALAVGEPFFFKTHAPHNRVVGGGFFSGFAALRTSEAWQMFGEANGATSLERMRERIAHFVSWYSGFRQAGVAARRHRGLPSPALTFILTLDDPLVVAEHADPRQPAGSYETLIGGLHTAPAPITHDGRQSGIQLGGGVVGGGGRGGVRPEVAHAWRRLRDSRGAVPVSSLAAETGWSARHLNAQFRAEIGLSPKAAARVFRFDGARRRGGLPRSSDSSKPCQMTLGNDHWHDTITATSGVALRGDGCPWRG